MIGRIFIMITLFSIIGAFLLFTIPSRFEATLEGDAADCSSFSRAASSS